MNRTFRFPIGSPSVYAMREYACRFATILLQLFQLLKVAFEFRVCLHTVLQTPQIPVELCRPPLRERIDNPVLLSLGCHHPAVSQIGEVLRDLHLRLA
jgi:hypothetical protein